MQKRRLIYIALALAVAAIVVIVLLMQNLDSLIERAIEKYGSAAAGTTVRVAAVKIELREGRGAIHGLTVANPPGFAREPLFALGEIFLAIDTASLTSQVPVIEEIRIATPQCLYQLNSKGESNLLVLQKHLKAGNNQPEPIISNTPPQRLKIKRLSIAGGKGTIDLSAFGGKRLQATLPTIVLTNLGGRNGLTAEELARVVISALVRTLEEAAVRQGAEAVLRKQGGDALQRLLGH